MKKKYLELKKVSMIQKVSYNKFVDWETAMKYADNLRLAGYSDWRLPTVKEASRIAKVFRKEMKLDWWYWTSTEYDASGAYIVGSSGGILDGVSKSSSYYCFCVR